MQRAHSTRERAALFENGAEQDGHHLELHARASLARHTLDLRRADVAVERVRAWATARSPGRSTVVTLAPVVVLAPARRCRTRPPPPNAPPWRRKVVVHGQATPLRHAAWWRQLETRLRGAGVA